MALKERMLLFIDYKGINKSAFEKKVGLSNGTVDKMGDGTRRSTIDKISNLYPDLNTGWLLTGEGDMLISSSSSSEQGETEGYYTYLLPVSAQGGTFNDFVSSVRLADCERIISPIRNVDFAIRVSGDSMAPEYPNGSQVLIKKINEHAFLEWGRVYVLDTCNGTVIKKLMPTKEKNFVLCESINPNYPPFEVSLSDVYGVYRVLMCMGLK